MGVWKNLGDIIEGKGTGSFNSEKCEMFFDNKNVLGLNKNAEWKALSGINKLAGNLGLTVWGKLRNKRFLFRRHSIKFPELCSVYLPPLLFIPE